MHDIPFYINCNNALDIAKFCYNYMKNTSFLLTIGNAGIELNLATLLISIVVISVVSDLLHKIWEW